MYNSNKFCDILHIETGITAVIGSGGKTSLIGRLCAELSERGRVLFTTTTHILRPQDMPVVSGEDSIPAAFEKLAAAGGKPIVCIGSEASDNPHKLCKPHASMEKLALLADYVLTEADGSKMLPIKAHREYEPVIPGGSRSVILVVGLSGIGGRVADKVHRIEEFKALTGAMPDDIVTAELVAKGIAAELGRYAGCNLKLYLNQTDITGGRELAEELASELRRAALDGIEKFVEEIYAGSLSEGYIYKL